MLSPNRPDLEEAWQLCKGSWRVPDRTRTQLRCFSFYFFHGQPSASHFFSRCFPVPCRRSGYGTHRGQWVPLPSGSFESAIGDTGTADSYCSVSCAVVAVVTGHLENREKSLKFKYNLSVEAPEWERTSEDGREATQVEGP